ncbi:MAG: OmpA family protein, partial [Treponema sp.]|nr:OmpA family protein [Treponema sp.]
LSEDRAHAVADALTERGISANSFICKGNGGRKPVADNKTTLGKARNRRVEITILE